MSKIVEFSFRLVMYYYLNTFTRIWTTITDTDARLIINENVERDAPIATGYDTSFIKMVSNSHITIDKTLLIKEIIETLDTDPNGEPILITCPHKWGKTTNMLMIQDYLQMYVNVDPSRVIWDESDNQYPHYYGVRTMSKGSNAQFFKNGTLDDNQKLENKFTISKHPDLSETYLGKYPVFYISFRGIQGTDYETFTDSLVNLITKAYEQYRYFKESYVKTLAGWYRSQMYESDGSIWDNQIFKKVYHTASLRHLCKMIYNVEEKPVIVLIDDYDEPINHALLHPHFEENDRYSAVEHYNEILKEIIGICGGERLKFLIMTGTYQWSGSHQSLSALEHVLKYNFLDDKFSHSFGINQQEFDSLCEHLGISWIRKLKMKKWFNGYRRTSSTSSGEQLDVEIFNPSSLAKFLQCDQFKDYLEGENNNIIDVLLPQFFKDEKFLDLFTRLLDGYLVAIDIEDLSFTPEENLGPRNIPYIESAFKFMLAAGYLSPYEDISDGRLNVMVPNQEINCRLRYILQNQLEEFQRSPEKRLQNLTLKYEEFASYDDSCSYDSRSGESMFKFFKKN